MKQHYIQAVLDLIAEGKDTNEVLSGLKSVLKAKGHDRLYDVVLRGVVKVLDNQAATETTVTVAKESDYEEHKAAIAAVLASVAETKEPKVKTDDSLIGGFVVEDRSTRVDASYKTKLLELYRSITN